MTRLDNQAPPVGTQTPLGLRPHAARGLQLQRPIQQAIQTSIECARVVRAQHGRQGPVDVNHIGAQGLEHVAPGWREMQDHLAAIASRRHPLDQALGMQGGDRARGSGAVQPRQGRQIRRALRAVLRQGRDQPPFPPRDAMASLTQANDRSTGNGNQAVQAKEQLVVDSRRIHQSVQSVDTQG